MNGGGWGCIYSHQPLPSRWAILLSVDGPPSWCGRSAPVDQRLKMQRSAVTAISTAILHFSEPVTFGFFGFLPTGRSAPEAGRSARGLGRSSLFLRTVCSGNLCFCIGSVRGSFFCYGRSAAGARTVRAWPVFPKSFSCPE
jgi:hypothetical protein